MATDLAAHPRAYRTGWKNVPQPKAAVVGARGARGAAGGTSSGRARGEGGRGRGRGGGGSGRGRAAFADAFSGFSSTQQPAAETPSLASEGIASDPSVASAAVSAAPLPPSPLPQQPPVFERTPTKLELACDPDDLKLIRD
eukprot:6191726-Pleurochrysis_carterae.AAC.1